MKDTEAQSAELKAKFKAHFAANGYEAPLPAELESEAFCFPIEWAEACHEWELYGDWPTLTTSLG